jgi:tetratricopeptide (TPR) repeat protein
MIRRSAAPSVAGFAAALLLSLGTPALALPGGGGKEEKEEQDSAAEDRGADEAAAAYERGMQLVKEARYQEALERFRAAAKREKGNPEYLNMVAYSLRKVGNLEDAFETYARVLAMKPDFAQAREYLGEAHIQAVLLQIDVLRGYGEKGKPAHDALVAALQEAAKMLQAEPTGGALGAPDKKGW